MLKFEWMKKMINVSVNILTFCFTGLEHNFEKYTRGEVKTLESMKDFYDFDVSETQNNIIEHFCTGWKENRAKGVKSRAETTAQQTKKIAPLRKLPTPPPPPKKNQ